MSDDHVMEVEKLRRALKRIRDYWPRNPLNEWSQAAAFREVQQIAADALSPGLRAARIRADEAARAADRRRVGALKRGMRYFMPDTLPGSGAWVRFLRGDGQHSGIAHVKVVEVVGRPISALMERGHHLEVYAGNLRAEPGVPIEAAP
jgi:hypothetical protein